MADSAEDILEALYAEEAAKPAEPASENAAPQVDGVQLEALYEHIEAAPTRKSPSPPPKHLRTPNGHHQQQQQRWRGSSSPAPPPPRVATAPARVVLAAVAVPAPAIVKPGMPLDLKIFNNAAVLVDKPKGWTSFDVCNAIRFALKPLKIQKVGHAGTLDPAATGLLIVCTGTTTEPETLKTTPIIQVVFLVFTECLIPNSQEFGFLLTNVSCETAAGYGNDQCPLFVPDDK
jgi:hypothetical protein